MTDLTRPDRGEALQRLTDTLRDPDIDQGSYFYLCMALLATNAPDVATFIMDRTDERLDLVDEAVANVATPVSTDDGGLGADATAVITRAAALLAEIYDPAGVLIYWSSKVTYLDGKRPCDLWRNRDMAALTRMCDRLDALADGNIG